MSKHILFLVHNMGNTKPGWSEQVQKCIRDKYQQYKISQLMKFDSNFVFCELNYNHVFTNHIEMWEENAKSVTRLLEASGIDNQLLSSLMGFSSKTARKDFASTHILDVILYRFMAGLKSQVIGHISEQMVAKLNEASPVPSYSIISHSLGTAVMHDVMQANMTTPHFPLSTAHGVAEVYMTLANVSRVLEGSESNVYSSAVRPRLSDNSRLYSCNQFINIAHNLDPFTRVKSFNPTWKKGANNSLDNLKYDSFQSVKIKGLTGINPHDFEHYLENPATHVPLFRCLLSKGAIKDPEFKQQLEAYKQKTLTGQFDDVKTKLQAISLSEASSLDEAVTAWTNFQKLIKELWS